jgi:methanogenic corrinoid protein MtbC1
VGERFERGEFYLADVLLAAEAMKSATGILLTGLSERVKTDLESKKLGKVVVATVSGDIHDIGKNIVATMLSVNDFTVHDLGRDRPSMEIINRALETGADIIALSALMTTSMPSQKEVIDLLTAMGIRN